MVYLITGRFGGLEQSLKPAISQTLSGDIVSLKNIFNSHKRPHTHGHKRTHTGCFRGLKAHPKENDIKHYGSEHWSRFFI
jgi:hypothetical protein